MASRTSPRDCALAVALPRDLEAFERDIREPGRHDFAACFAQRYPDHTPAQLWPALLAPTTARVEEILASVAEMGVHVVRDARLADVGPLFDAFQVVTIATHWRGPWVQAHQIRDTALIVDALTEGAARRAWPADTAISAARAGDVDALVVALNNLLANADLGPSSCPAAWHGADDLKYRAHANRDALDAVLSPGLSAAPPLEFRDGMRSIEQLLERIPPCFDGCLDLTLCNSMIAVDEIKRRRRFTCLGNEDTTELGFRMELYEQTIRTIHRAPFCYAEAAREIRIALIQTLET